MARKEEGPKDSSEGVLKGKNILVISNNEEMGEFLENLLGSMGAVIDKELDARRALEVFVSLEKAKIPPNLIVAADPSSYDLDSLKKIKEAPGGDKIPLIIIDNKEAEKEMAEMAKVIPLPFELSVFLAVLVNALDDASGSCSAL